MSEELFRNRLTLIARKGMFRTLSNNQGHLKQTFGPYPLSELISFSQSSIAVEFKKGEKPSIMLKLFFSTAKWCKHRLNRRVIKYGQIEVLLSTIWIFTKIDTIGTKNLCTSCGQLMPYVGQEFAKSLQNGLSSMVVWISYVFLLRGPHYRVHWHKSLTLKACVYPNSWSQGIWMLPRKGT